MFLACTHPAFLSPCQEIFSCSVVALMFVCILGLIWAAGAFAVHPPQCLAECQYSLVMSSLVILMLFLVLTLGCVRTAGLNGAGGYRCLHPWTQWTSCSCKLSICLPRLLRMSSCNVSIISQGAVQRKWASLANGLWQVQHELICDGVILTLHGIFPLHSSNLPVMQFPLIWIGGEFISSCQPSFWIFFPWLFPSFPISFRCPSFGWWIWETGWDRNNIFVWRCQGKIAIARSSPF